jgi:hypothetical protein
MCPRLSNEGKKEMMQHFLDIIEAAQDQEIPK